MLRSPIARVIPYAVLLAELLIFYRHVLFSNGYAMPLALRSRHLPIAEFVAQSFRKGEVPLWDPFTNCGVPFFADIQTQLFYAPATATVWLSNLIGRANLLDLLEWQIVLHAFLGGVLAYHLLRRLGVTISAALLGGTVFQLGGYFASQTQHLGAMCGGAWLPLAWLSVIELAVRFRVRWLAALAASFTMSALAGSPGVAVTVNVSSLLLGVIMTVFGLARIRLLAAILGACVWSVLLASVQLFPAFQFAAWSASRIRTDGLASTGGLPLQSLMSLIIPNYFGIFDLSRYSAPWNPDLLYVYCGVAGLVTAVIGALLWRKIRQSIVFATVTLASALWMLGDSTLPGRLIVSVLPEFVRGMIHPECAMLAFSLGMAVLAGLGATFFRPSRSPYVGAVLVFFAAFDLIAVGSDRPMNTVPLAAEPASSRTGPPPSGGLCEAARSLPRFFLVGQVRRAASLEAALAAVREPRFDARESAIVEDPREFRGLEPTAGSSSVRVIEYTARSVALESHSPAPAFLVTSEAYYPGWRAFVDGRPERLALTNVAFRGLPVPAGRHRVEMRFEPGILRYSAVVSGFTWLAWLFCFRPMSGRRVRSGKA